MLSEIFMHLFMTKNLQFQWRAKFMNFWLTYFRSRFALCSLWSGIFLCLLWVHCTLLAPPPPPHKFCIDYCFQILFGRTVYSHKDMKTIPYAKFEGVTRVPYGDFKKSQWEGGACAPVAPLPHYSPLQSHAAMGFFLAAYSRELWSRKYLLRTCIRKTALWLKG